jgi:hypothetical protein
MNKSQWEVRQKANNELRDWLRTQVNSLQTKGWTKDQVAAKYGDKAVAWQDEQEQLDRAKTGHDMSEKWMTKMANSGDLGSRPNVPVGKKLTGAHVSPMAFSEPTLKAMYKAYVDGQPLSVKAESKAFSTVDPLLPAQLDPIVVPQFHEWRILDHLPAIGINAPSYEFIIHSFSGDTLGGGSVSSASIVVSEGGTKPEYIPDVTSSVATAVKLALHTGISRETLADWDQWLGYLQGQVYAFPLVALPVLFDSAMFPAPFDARNHLA